MNLLIRYLASTPQNDIKSDVVAVLAQIETLKSASPKIAEEIVKELQQQRSVLKLIASENYCSLAVQLAMGNWLTDKYAEGVPGRRFYAGCEQIDRIEALAQEELCQLFECEYANVQPHCGADANLLAYWAILVEKVQNKELEALGKKTLEELVPAEYETIRRVMMQQKILGMSLNSGGHLTHGYRHNISAKIFQAFSYDVDPITQLIDYDALQRQALEVKPLILVAGYSAYPRLIDFEKMRHIADSVGAVLLVDMAHFAGLVAGKVMTGVFNPVPYADIITSTTHKTLRGPRGGIVLAKKEWASILNKGCPLTMGGPLPHVMAAKAVAFQEARKDTFKAYAKQIVKNSQALAAALMQAGVTLTTGGSDNHLIVADMRSFGLTGMQAEKALRACGIAANRNAIPFDPNGAWHASGIRIGTAALTTLGMREKEMEKVAALIVEILSHATPKDKSEVVLPDNIKQRVNDSVQQLLNDFPLYPELQID